MIPGAATLIYWGATIGVPITIKGVLYLYTAVGGYVTFLSMQAYDKNKARKEVDQVNKVMEDKKKLEAKHFNLEKEEEKIKIAKEFLKVENENKERAIAAYNLAEQRADQLVTFAGIKPPTMNSLLLGHYADGKPYWGTFTNFIIAGSTGSRKSRKLHAMLLNFLANKQGTVYIADFKMTDFKQFKEKQGVVKYIDDPINSKELIEAFKAEYQRRLDLINAGNYVDIDDYNNNNPDNIQKPYIMLIDEYADLSDTYKGKQGQPIGPYQDLIELARKIRATGGRIILGTQRPSADVVIGTLKNNTQIIGMKCLNEINSKIMVDQGGCEKLLPGEALTIDGQMIKIFNYDLDNDYLKTCINKLK